jgi:hypothetical protein
MRVEPCVLSRLVVLCHCVNEVLCTATASQIYWNEAVFRLTCIFIHYLFNDATLAQTVSWESIISGTGYVWEWPWASFMCYPGI